MKQRPALPGLAAALALAGLLAGGCVSQGPSILRQDGIDPDRRAEFAAGWRPRLVTADAALLRGEASPAGGAGTVGQPMMYPAPTPAGGLLAVLTHSALAAGTQQNRLQAEAEAADAVAAPYQERARQIPPERLLRDALSASRSGAGRQPLAAIPVAEASPERPVDGPELQLAPVYRLTQDQRALVLDLALQARLPGTTARFETLVRVVSAPSALAGDAAREAWLASDGALLDKTLTGLLAAAIDLGVADATGRLTEAAAQEATLRLRIGGQERFERGRPLRQDCRRITLQTLRGWIVDAPKAKPDDGCEAAGAT